jgi:hypothetical protein
MQHCVVCGRELLPENIAQGVCPSCGTPVQAVPPAQPAPPYSGQLTPSQPAPAQPFGEQQPGFPPPAPYGAQPGYTQPMPTGEQQPGFPPPAPYGAQPGYPPPMPYGEQQPGYPPSTPYPGQPGYPPSTPYGAQPGYPPSMPYAGQPGYPPSTPYGAQPGYPPVPPTPQSNSNLGIIVGIVSAVVVVLLALMIGLVALGKNGSGPLKAIGPTATPTFTPTPTLTPTPAIPTVPPAPSGFKQFTTQDYGLNYPTNWSSTDQTESNVTLHLFSDATAQTVFEILPVPSTAGSIGPGDYKDLLQSFYDTMGASNVQIDTSTNSVTAGKNNWTTISGTGKYNGTVLKTTAYVGTHGTTTYVLIALAPNAQYTTLDSTYFQPMIKSFTYLTA